VTRKKKKESDREGEEEERMNRKAPPSLNSSILWNKTSSTLEDLEREANAYTAYEI
jgi:hypothetical protein